MKLTVIANRPAPMEDLAVVKSGIRPKDTSVEPVRAPSKKPEPPTGPILKGWRRIFGGCLTGRIYNDPRRRFPDGEVVTTSRVEWLNEEAGLAQTRNTLYLLRDAR